MPNMENTYTPNDNITLTYPYAAKDTNQLLYIVLGPSTMTPCNVIRVDSTALVPMVFTNGQINALQLIPEGVLISLKINPQYEIIP
jgi:hypothetical protein